MFLLLKYVYNQTTFPQFYHYHFGIRSSQPLGAGLLLGEQRDLHREVGGSPQGLAETDTNITTSKRRIKAVRLRPTALPPPFLILVHQPSKQQ